MPRTDVLAPYVEKIIKEVSGNENAIQAEDGSYGFRWGSSGFRIKLVDNDPALVAIWAIVLVDVKKSNKLLEKLNEINSGMYFARIFWSNNAIIMSAELIAETLDAQELGHASAAIGSMADHFDTELQKEFGGTKLGEDEQADSVQV